MKYRNYSNEIKIISETIKIRPRSGENLKATIISLGDRRQCIIDL